jgi:hypothetical protein
MLRKSSHQKNMFKKICPAAHSLIADLFTRKNIRRNHLIVDFATHFMMNKRLCCFTIHGMKIAAPLLTIHSLFKKKQYENNNKTWK